MPVGHLKDPPVTGAAGATGQVNQQRLPRIQRKTEQGIQEI